MKFRPLHDRVVIRRIEGEEKTKGGIIIPDTAKEKPQEGEVITVGPGARDESGKLVPLDVKAGDRVLFGKWSGTEVKIDGEDLLIMKEFDVMGVIEAQAPRRRRPPETASPLASNQGLSNYVRQYVLPTPATACCAASISSTTPSRPTPGPKGRNVVLDKSYGAPRITKDGVTVAKEIELEDKFENMGAQMVRQVASKTSDNAGDGTTTATVLTASMIKEGLKLVAALDESDGPQARHRYGGGGRRQRHPTSLPEGPVLRRDRPGRHHFGQRR